MTRSQFSPIRMTASTQEAAVEQALQIVGASHDDVSVEVLSQDAKGVTVRVSPRRDDEIASDAPIETVAPVESVEETLIDSEIEAGDASEAALMIEDEASEAEATAEMEADVEEVDAPVAQAETPKVVEREEVEIKMADAATLERVRVLAQDFLDRMGLVAQATPSDTPLMTRSRDKRDGREERDVPRAFLQIDGEDVGILIGKHGQTLQSFQYLLNVSLNNQLSGEELESGAGVRVMVDAGGYRAKRGDSLQQMATDAATRAKADRRAIRMEPMPAHERRLVHMALESDSQITTSSEGREPLRHVVVIPEGAARPAPSRDAGERSGSERSGSERSGGRQGGFGGRSERGGYAGSGGGFSRGGNNRGGSRGR